MPLPPHMRRKAIRAPRATSAPSGTLPAVATVFAARQMLRTMLRFVLRPGLRPMLALALIAALAAIGATGPTAAPVDAQTALEWTLTEVRQPSFDAGTLFDPAGVDSAPGGRFYVVDRGHHRVAIVDGGGGVVRAFGQRGGGPSEFESPRDIAIDAARDRVYVTDVKNRRLSIFTLTGTPVGQWMHAGSDEAFTPFGVAVAPSGDVYVLSSPTVRIERFSPDGTWLGGWGVIGSGAEELSNPEGIAIHTDGSVIVADSGNRRLQVYSADGSRLLRTLPGRGVWDVTVEASTGRVFVLQDSPIGGRDQIAVYSSDFALERVVNSNTLAVDARFAPARHVAVGETGRLGVTSSEGAPMGLHGLRQLEPDDSLSARSVADPHVFGGFLSPLAIDVGPDDMLYVLEDKLNMTKRYDALGAFDRRFDSAWGDELAVGSGGDLYLASTAGEVILRHVGPDDRERRVKACDCINGIGIAPASSQVWVTSAMNKEMVAFDSGSDAPDPIRSATLPAPGYAWPLDLALAPDGRVWATGGETGALTAHDGTTGNLVASVALSTSDGPHRVSAGSDGGIATLQLSGSITTWGSDGTRLFEWMPEPAPGRNVVEPIDVAVGADDRVYVLDRVSSAILVYDKVRRPATPTPTTVPEAPCTVTGDKVASPTILPLGEEVTLELSFDLSCRAGREPKSEIMLIIDRSNSMAGQKLSAARGAAESFISSPDLDLTRDRVGLVSFSDVVSLDQPLTSDREAIRSAIRAVLYRGATDLAGSVRRAARHTAEAGRPDSTPVLLMLTDGRPNRDGQPFVDAYLESARARASGALVYTIGLGDSVVEDLMIAMAGSSSRYFAAAGPEALVPIYDELSRTVGGVVASDVAVVDGLGDDVEYVAGSATRGGAPAGRQILWDLGPLASGSVSLQLRVRPTRLGIVPTNSAATMRYVVDGIPYDFVFPIPEVRVVDVTATPTPSPTATRRPSSGPGTIYLPIAMRSACSKKDARLGSDIVLVIDTSSSMAGAKIEAARTAATRFLDSVDPRRDRVGLITFDGAANRVWPITANLPLIAEHLAAIRTGSGTRIDLGLEEALREIGFRSRPGSQRVIVLLSDGLPTGGTARRARDVASIARSSGVTLFAIGLGGDADAGFLTGLAGDSKNVFLAPTPGDLEAIYRRVAGQLPCR